MRHVSREVRRKSKLSLKSGQTFEISKGRRNWFAPMDLKRAGQELNDE